MKGWPNSSDSQQTLYDAVLQQHRWCLMFFSSKSCAAVDALCENLHSACGFTFSHRTSSCFRDFLHLHIRSRELCMFGTSFCSGKTPLLWGVSVFMSWRPYGTWNAGIDQSCSVVSKTLSSEKCIDCPKCARLVGLVGGLLQSAFQGCKRDWPHDKSCKQ